MWPYVVNDLLVHCPVPTGERLTITGTTQLWNIGCRGADDTKFDGGQQYLLFVELLD